MKKYLLLAIPALITAMSASSQELKTYSGPFKYKPHQARDYDSDRYTGEATYTYRDAEDGTRIFHGDFIFKYYDNEWCVVQGKFTDNKQTGTWSYKKIVSSGDGRYRDVIINFNNEGYPDGEVSYVDYYSMTEWTFSIKDGKIEGLVKKSSSDYNGEYITTYSMTGGIVNGEYTKTYDGKVYQTGMFDNGKPVRKWVSEYGIESAYYDDNGELKYVIDETTGDKLTDKHFDIPDPEIPKLYEEIDMFLMRDSKLKPE